MRRINYKSDFDFILRLEDCNGDAVGFPACDWTARLYTVSKANAYVASCIGGVCANCFNDNGEIHVVVDGHRLGAGRLKVEFVFELPNRIYPDGSRREVTPVPLGIELVTGAGDCPTGIEVEAVVPYAVIDAYDMAREAGYAGTRDDYVAQLVQLGDTAAMVSDFKAGKSKVADALTRRGYPTDADAPFDEMAQTIEDMSWGVGPFASIGYDEQVTDESIGVMLAYSKKKMEEWDEDSESAAGLFKDDTSLIFAPRLNMPKVTNLSEMFYRASKLLSVPPLDAPIATGLGYMFAGCTSLQKIRLGKHSARSLGYCFNGCSSLVELDMGDTHMVNDAINFLGGCSSLVCIAPFDVRNLKSFASTSIPFLSCTSLREMTLINFGVSSQSQSFTQLISWGGGDEKARKTLVDTFLTYSHDRVAAGMSAITIALAENARSRLTPEEIAAITAKGYTIA